MASFTRHPPSAPHQRICDACACHRSTLSVRSNAGLVVATSGMQSHQGSGGRCMGPLQTTVTNTTTAAAFWGKLVEVASCSTPRQGISNASAKELAVWPAASSTPHRSSEELEVVALTMPWCTCQLRPSTPSSRLSSWGLHKGPSTGHRRSWWWWPAAAPRASPSPRPGTPSSCGSPSPPSPQALR